MLSYNRDQIGFQMIGGPGRRANRVGWGSTDRESLKELEPDQNKCNIPRYYGTT
jgi:hypothetical protein